MKQTELLKQAILLADNADLKNMLLQVLQANTPEISTKFNIFDFCDKNNKGFRDFDALQIKNGAYYATNAHVLCKLIVNYPSDHDNMLLYRDGKVKPITRIVDFDIFIK